MKKKKYIMEGQVKIKSDRDWEKIKVADRLGLGEKLRLEGWGALTARETGRIGAQMHSHTKTTAS